MKDELTHIDKSGRARMVDISGKTDTHRVAIAEGKIFMKKETLEKIESSGIAKGDVISVAKIAGIMSAKRTYELIPLCHNILLNKIDINLESFTEDDQAGIKIIAEVSCIGKTGAEMEALTAVSVYALTIYDMCKAIDKGMRITDIRLLEKRGGKSGTWKANGE